MSETFVPVAPMWWVTNLGGLTVNGIVAARRKSTLTRLVFGAAVVTHVVEAGYAYGIAQRAGFDDAWKWGLQTLGVGFPSLFALNEVIATHAAATAEG